MFPITSFDEIRIFWKIAIEFCSLNVDGWQEIEHGTVFAVVEETWNNVVLYQKDEIQKRKTKVWT